MILVTLAGLLLLLAGFVSGPKDKTNFEIAREAILMRQVAHRILLYSGDSSTPVLPATRVSENEFRLSFNSGFSFKPDSLVNIIGKVISGSGMSPDYIVQVTEPQKQQVVFGYAIQEAGKKNIVPCSGRDQPAKAYSILISFKNKSNRSDHWMMMAGIALLLPAGFVAWNRNRKRSPLPPVPDIEEQALTANCLSIGRYQFSPSSQSLVLDGETILLTGKESKLLQIFAAAPNEIIDRQKLQSVWEEEGVIVGRSLDVFVSRLRKRLEGDPSVKIVSIHGKGYRLEVNSSPY